MAVPSIVFQQEKIVTNEDYLPPYSLSVEEMPGRPLTKRLGSMTALGNLRNESLTAMS